MYEFIISTTATKGGRITLGEVSISVPIKNHGSPFVISLQKLEDLSRLNPKQRAHTSVLKQTIEYLSIAIPQLMNIPLSKHSRESFDDFLYAVEEAGDKQQLSSFMKKTSWGHIKSLLRINHQSLGDGTQIVTCLNDYVDSFQEKSLRSEKTVLNKLSVVPHKDLKDLELQATAITKKMLDDVILACQKDLDQYLRLCGKQNGFEKYKISEEIKADLYRYATSRTRAVGVKGRSSATVVRALLSFIRDESNFNFFKNGVRSDELNFPSGSTLPLLNSFRHYATSPTMKPWFFCQYRLPNHILTCCYIFLLAKTGWNIASVGSLTISDIKKLPNGTYEIQSSKHKTGDDTPKISISKADKYFKLFISLLLWNHSQLVKYFYIKSSNENVWYGWQRSYDQPMFPLEVFRQKIFYNRHQLPRMAPSSIRPIKSSFNFLKHQDIELVRMSLGHSNLETTVSYLKNNLIYHLNESRILEFQKRFESTIAYENSTAESFESRGFNKEKIDPSLSTKAPLDEKKSENKFFNEVKSFLLLIGVKEMNDSSIITSEALKQVILLKEYYRLRWRKLHDKNYEYFMKYHINVIFYIHVFIKVARERKPLLVENMLKSAERGRLTL